MKESSRISNPYEQKESCRGPETGERSEKEKGLFSKDLPKQNQVEQKDAPQPVEVNLPNREKLSVAVAGDSEEKVIDYGDYELHAQKKTLLN